MQLKISDICTVINAKSNANPELKLEIEDLLIDSRKLLNIEKTLFFALLTKTNDGHKYIKSLYDKGVKMFVVSHDADFERPLKNAILFKVTNTLEALQKLTAWHRSQFQIPIVGITGSNGKTIVKEWVYQLLSPDYQLVRSPKSYNSQVGVPLSVWQMSQNDEFAVFEAGISESGEMEKLQKIIKPSIGIFTNIGVAHDENFMGQEHKIAEKIKLFTSVESMIYCSDYKGITEVLVKSGIYNKIKVYTWGNDKDAHLSIVSVEKKQNETEIKAKYNNEIYELKIPFLDSASFENAMHTWLLMIILKYDFETIKHRMAMLTPVAMRLELKAGINNCSVIDDTYNSDVNSLRIALDFMETQQQFKKRSVILSDMFQTGQNDDTLYKGIAEMLKNKNVDYFFGIGKDLKKYSHFFEMKSKFYETTDEFISNFNFSAFSNELILIKGARCFEFERISKVLQYKTHNTLFEINLDAIEHNLKYYKSKLKLGTKIMAMVKAFSYGSGSYEIANLLQFNNIDYLGVAYVDEGVELRKNGISTPIMVMYPQEDGFYNIIKYNLEPEISSLSMLNTLEEKLILYRVKSPLPIHIKIDTGMHRLGFCLNELDDLIEKLQQMSDKVIVKSVFTHLAASDDAKFDDFTKEQIEKLQKAKTSISEYIKNDFFVHALNTAGIIRFPEYHFDMVRLGIGMYGVPSIESEKDNLQNVCTLKTRISQVKNIMDGETVSYGRKWKANGEKRIAVLPIGYADGLPRNYGFEKSTVLINGQKAKIVGAICMDMCMIDIADIEAQEGDEVIIFGDDYTVTDMSEILDTIAYEVLTNISQRVKRIYVKS